MTMLDRSRQAGEQGSWQVLTLNQYALAAGSIDPYSTELVEAASVELWDGGTLVFRTERGGLVKSYGPGGWLEVERA